MLVKFTDVDAVDARLSDFCLLMPDYHTFDVGLLDLYEYHILTTQYKLSPMLLKLLDFDALMPNYQTFAYFQVIGLL